MSNVRDVKNRMRADIRAARETLTDDHKKALDQAICKQFRSLASFRFAEVVLAYYPLDEEIDIRPLIEEALALGKRVALPRCHDGNLMDFYLISSLDDVESGAYGIFEPKTTCEIYDLEETKPAIMIIPALAYDKFGYRLGYGRGYYDRYVNRFGGVKAGLCYRAFFKDTPLPRGRYDMAVDYVVTEKGVKLVEKK